MRGSYFDSEDFQRTGAKRRLLCWLGSPALHSLPLWRKSCPLGRRELILPDRSVVLTGQRRGGHARHRPVADSGVVTAGRYAIAGVIAVASIVVAAARDDAVERINAFAFVVGGMSGMRGETATQERRGKESAQG